MKRTLFYISLMSYALGMASQTLENRLTDWLTTYERWDARINRPTLTSCNVDDSRHSIEVILGGGFSEQHFTPVVVDSLYERVRSFLPSNKRRYDLAIITEDHRIEDLIPNFFRKGKKDGSRLLQETYNGAPWVKNLSRPYTAPSGLEGSHISLWQSHGIYFKNATSTWTWQRPRLFCTCEDLFSQTFVIPYIIPMLQNAGAIVFTPRERDWQNHEVIVDNDHPQKDGLYIESQAKKKGKKAWATAPDNGFSNNKTIYQVSDTPFSDGTARYIQTVSNIKDVARSQWIPNIPESGRYAVYVTYKSYQNSITDAHYTVFHKGGMTEFAVNQQIGGGTWVYLGTFEFGGGTHDTGMVVLTNQSSHKGVVSADAVRFGSGMSNVVPENSYNLIQPSGLPRWAEAAKYSAFWYGFPYSVHSGRFENNDYNNDINARSAAVNYLSRGSIYNQQVGDGLRVPLELNIAFHTDAGYKMTGEFIGPLAIYKTDFNEGLTGAGLDRYVSRDLASMLLTNLTTDLRAYNWTARKLWNRDYGEAREPMTPACILEMLSHQNFYDLRLGYDPKFKFDMCRSIYKTIVKFIATEHKRDYVIQPLPVTDFSISLNEKKQTANLSWTPVNDPLEPTATPQKYIVYTRIGNMGFDNGTLVSGTTFSISLEPDMVYSFKVTALNKGGESFPSETLAAGISSKNQGTTLIVNAFTRLEGPQSINTPEMQGFDLDADPGVQYGAFAGFSGRQVSFDTSKAGSEAADGLGASGEELAGKIIMGNTFDYAAIHGKAILLAGHSFTSTSETALLKHYSNAGNLISSYPLLDIIYGVQKVFNNMTSTLVNDYISRGGRTLMSGANIGETPLRNKSLTAINGCGTNFQIWREMNAYSYSVPAPTTVSATNGAFSMLLYQDGTSAGIAKESGQRFIKLGFPIESITETSKINQLMSAFMAFLRK